MANLGSPITGPGEEVSSIRVTFGHLQQEGRLNWRIRVIEGQAISPDCWRIGRRTFSSRTGTVVFFLRHSIKPYEIARQLRKAVEVFASDGPFLVAQVSDGTARFREGVLNFV
jgi:hypothetical protein